MNARFVTPNLLKMVSCKFKNVKFMKERSPSNARFAKNGHKVPKIHFMKERSLSNALFVKPILHKVARKS